MAKISDFEVEYKAYNKDKLVTTFVSNLWGEQETFRRLLGPDSLVDNYDIEYKGRTIKTIDPINWDHPVCCDHCREEAEERKQNKLLKM